MSRSDFSLLREILESTNLKVMVLWRSEYEEYDALVEHLLSEGLNDCHIVCFNSALYSPYLVYGGFWRHAEDVVKWKEEVEDVPANPFENLAKMELPALRL
ncbi:hypothetical protein SCLCIDRAFT_10894 [Scleroderma citrinum Foug A]|uniref:Uncharacterized protein n=1 Tax=Scleroderma citrinum Foug A TaxID=1036808 RepID=A0A0C3D4U3_9AGAM|nr:hypothetical protein SCLCIDRAFT_10894 [Scleroderma citrinum Foug A]